MIKNTLLYYHTKSQYDDNLSQINTSLAIAFVEDEGAIYTHGHKFGGSDSGEVDIPDASVTTAKLANGAVTNDKLANEVKTAISSKQDVLDDDPETGNIRKINGMSLIGSGNIEITPGGVVALSDWAEDDLDDPAYIKNKPTIPLVPEIDSTPTPNSDNLITSGGVYNAINEIDSIETGSITDTSTYERTVYSGTTYYWCVDKVFNLNKGDSVIVTPKHVLAHLTVWAKDPIALTPVETGSYKYTAASDNTKITVGFTAADEFDYVITRKNSILDKAVKAATENTKSEIIESASTDYNTLGKIESRFTEEKAARDRKDSEYDASLNNRYTKDETNDIVSRTPETDVIVINVPTESQNDIAGWLDANTPNGTDPETGKSVRANKLYRVSGPDNTTFSEWGWDGTNYIMLANKDYGFDDEPTLESSNLITSGGVASNLGYYAKDPEWSHVILDGAERVIGGIKKDGSIEWVKGVPTPIKNHVAEHIQELNELVSEELDGKVNKEEGKTLIDGEFAENTGYIDNPEYSEIKTDRDNRLLEATRKNSDKEFYVNVHFSRNISVDNTLAFSDIKMYYIDNPEYKAVFLDGTNHVLAGVKKDGELYWSKGMPLHLQQYIDSKIKALEKKEELLERKSYELDSLGKTFVESGVIYKNPVTEFNRVIEVHPDATIFRYNDMYYMYCSAPIKNSPLAYSTDLTKWQESENALFSQATVNKLLELRGSSTSDIWAPHIVKVGNRWNFYGSIGNQLGIFVLTSESPIEGFDFEGEPKFMITPEDVGIPYDVIDPCFASDGTNNYLFFGSANGVFRVQLSQNGLDVEGDYERVLGVEDQSTVSYGNFEGTMLYKHGNYWYMFASPRSDYKVLCWRSTTLDGVFINKDGDAATSGKLGELVCDGNAYFENCGHISDIIEIGGRTFATCNARVGDYPSQAMYGNRQQVLFEILWDNNGWPYTKNHTVEIYNPKNWI